MSDSASPRSKKVAHIAGIDGLRTIAVLSVLIFHIWPKALAGGFVGVDVFFVISGYVVTGSLYRSEQTKIGGYLTSFYSRRLLRICPPLIVCLLLTSIAMNLFIPHRFNSYTRPVAAAMVGISNFLFASETGGYFNNSSDTNPVLHTWSLGVEEQFYLLFPLLLFGSRTSSQVHAVWRGLSRILLPITVLASFVFCAFVTSRDPNHAYYLITSRFWELGVGAGLFLFREKTGFHLRTPGNASIVLAAGLFLVGFSTVFASESAFPFPWAIPPVIGTALLIMGVVDQNLSKQNWIGNWLAHPVMTYGGAISYSLYLWHWPVLAMMRWTVGVTSLFDGFLVIAASFILAVLSYNLVETPTRAIGHNKSIPPGRIVFASLVIVAVCSVGSLAFRKVVGERISLSVTKDSSLWFSPTMNQGEVVRLGPAESAGYLGPRLFVVGDSHAMVLRPLLTDIAKEFKLPTTLESFPGLPVLRMVIPTKDADVKARLDRLSREARSGDIIFIPGIRTPKSKTSPNLEAEATILANDSAASQADFKLGLEEADSFVSQLEAKGVWVIFDAPKPMFEASPGRCSDWFNRNHPDCRPGFSLTLQTFEKVRAPIMKSLRTLQDRHPNFVVWDIVPDPLCADGDCRAYEGTKPLFYDSNHLSVYANKVVAPSFRRILTQILTTKIPAKSATD